MRLILLLLCLLPLLVQSQSIKVDTLTKYGKGVEVDSIILGDTKIIGERLYVKKRSEPKLYKLQPDTLPSNGTTIESLKWYNGNRWMNNWTTELVKGKVETPINVMDSGMKVEVVETRDTIYKCPYSNNITFFTTTTTDDGRKLIGCSVDKIVTTRRYKLYIINEYGQKEYLSMELTKTK